jgi:hypothetical protein
MKTKQAKTKKPKRRIERGPYWHVHHLKLWEYCYDVAERRAYIRSDKPIDERPIRLRLMKPITHVGLTKTQWEMVKELKAMERKFRQLRKHDWTGVGMHLVRARINRLAKKLNPILNRVHKKQCPNCPWNGRTIFPIQP